MAEVLSGYITTNAPYEGRYMRVDWSATQSTANNESYLSFSIYPVGGSVSYYWTGPTYLYVNGSQIKSWERQEMWTQTSSHSRTTLTASTTLKHAQDGKRSFTLSIGTQIYYKYENATGSGSFTLKTIPRATEISAVPSFNVEDSFSCTFTPYVNTFTHSLQVKLNNQVIKTANPYTSGTAVTLTNTEVLHAYEAMGSARSADFTFELTTYDNGTSLGKKTKLGTGTCRGTAMVNVGGTWKQALPWINDNGTWKKALAYTRASGAWKRGK